MNGTSVSQRIEYLSVIGGFLDGLHVRFGAGLNTIIGARGTGKTTVVECLAYALDTLPSSDHAPQERKRVETLIKRNLNGGRIEVGIRAKDGTPYKVTRSFGEEPIVVDADGVAATVNLKAGLFRADVYGQNAVESIADRPLFQLDLIDSFATQAIQQIASREKQIVSMLAANAHQILPLEQEVGNIQDELAGLPGVEQKLKEFAGPAGGVTAEVNEAHRLKGLRDRESRLLQRGREQIGQLVESLRQIQIGLLRRSGSMIDAETAKGPNGDVFITVGHQWDACNSEVDRLLLQAADRLAALDAEFVLQAEQLTQRHRQQELVFRTTIEKHQLAQSQAVERSALEKQRNHLSARQIRLDEVQRRIGELRADRTGLLQQLSDFRDGRFAERRQVAQRINEALSPTIRVTISQYGNTDQYRATLESRLKGSGVKQAVVAQRIASSLTPPELAQVIRDRDTDTLIDRAELSAEQATHNPNIPVLGDAEQVVVLDSDGYKSRLIKDGNVDKCKEEIVTLLEGGAEAFQKRGERYGKR